MITFFPFSLCCVKLHFFVYYKNLDDHIMAISILNNRIQMSTNVDILDHIFVQVAANAGIQKVATSAHANSAEEGMTVIPYFQRLLLQY